ncbi:Ger(x)C family spore germination protein [Petroclostridium sp. X23]|uniref:Ger(x)C family spore germination protein n=1 Tax=Petroclostridium sp. X23 TaxID=3045146 RepID=UPI0024ACABB1|nr:Ger(x)C family spore germination protein [Petroclostridium sp. X23]WHH60075.1 Ger(x)C family spore germination protein [Petroclostridium sp. X23]
MEKILILFLCSVLSIMTGCWDREDIENRGYVLGVAVDSYPPVPKGQVSGEESETAKEEIKFEKMQLHEGEPRYAMTIQLPIIKKATLRTAAGSGGGGGDGAATWDITQVGNSFISMNREMASRTDVVPFYEHLQVIVISEDVAKQGIQNVIDFFIRDPEMRRRTRVFISKGEAKRILDVIPRREDYASLYLAKLPEHATKSSRIIHRTDLGEASISINEGEAFVLPRVEATKDELKTNTAAVFKKGKMLGWISPIEMEYVKLVRDLYLGGVITAKCPQDENGIITFEVGKAKTKITPIIEGREVSFKVDIKMEGGFAEETDSGSIKHIINEEYLKEAEKAFAKMVNKQCLATIESVQKKYGADIFHFSRILKTEEPAYWVEIKDQWDEMFPRVEVVVNTNVGIKQVGNIR